MNIFFLDKNPAIAAQYHCDKHVVKMILESAQLLSSVHHYYDSEFKDQCYKLTHKNHPCAVWARENIYNYKWLYDLFIELGLEYTRRYNRTHKSIIDRADVLLYLPVDMPGGIMQPPPLCMPDQYKINTGNPFEDAVASYRQYYMGEKAYFAKWKLGAPEWWKPSSD